MMVVCPETGNIYVIESIARTNLFLPKGSLTQSKGKKVH